MTSQKQLDPFPESNNYDPEPADGYRIGESPLPGLTLKRILRGHTAGINRMAWSPNGRFLASPSDDGTVRVWDVDNEECVVILKGQKGVITHAAWSPNGEKLASSSEQQNVYCWNVSTGEPVTVLETGGAVYSLAWSPDGEKLASGSDPIHVWDTETWELITVLKDYGDIEKAIAWAPNGKLLASGSNSLRIWDTELWQPLFELTEHTTLLENKRKGSVYSLAWSRDGLLLASGSSDGTVRVWDTGSGKLIKAIEGHTGGVTDVGFDSSGKLLVSKDNDGLVRFSQADNLIPFAELRESPRKDGNWNHRIALTLSESNLATVVENDTAIRIWNIDLDSFFSHSALESIQYTTAKIVLVGDSGVGKTGLGWRIAHNEFKDHASTHGQQFWVIKELGKMRDDGTECEAVLWDLAGQHVYRPVHSIFLDNVDASIVLFDPTNRQDPLKGVQFWVEQLKGKSELPPSVLVGARSDRGVWVLSQQELEQFCQHFGISGGYLSTSAKNGDGLEHLMTILKEQIPWNEMTATVTTVTFKRIKDFVLGLKEKPKRKDILVNLTELHQALQAVDDSWELGDVEIMTAVGHLENHGYVTILKSSSGDQFILLVPDLLVKLASSIVLLADKNPHELGAINETELLQGAYTFEELQGLDEAEQHVLLDAAVLRFLEHNICFRERLDENTLLIFPGLIKQKRPLQDDIPSTDDISYIVRGRVENIYASLVALLGYTPAFSRINQWQNQAQYETDDGHICGFRLVEDREGEIELILYYSDAMPADERLEFQGLFERFLYQRDVQVTPFPLVMCSQGHIQERATVLRRQQSSKKFLFCDECGEKLALPDVAEIRSIGTGASLWLQREEAIARLRSTYETNLSNIKSYRRGWANPRCFISFVSGEEKWAIKLRHDLNKAGVYVLEEAGQIQKEDFVIILDSPAYQQTWEQENPILKETKKYVQARFDSDLLVVLALAGKSSRLHDFNSCESGNLTDRTHYDVSLFDLVLNLYKIPLSHAGFLPLRKALHEQWERTLAGRGETEAEQARQKRTEFLRLLDVNFKESELQDVCFSLNIDFENLKGETKRDKARELLQYCERFGRVAELQTEAQNQRPRVNWPKLSG